LDGLRNSKEEEMSDYIKYLESTTEVQALRIADLQAALMTALAKLNKCRIDLELGVQFDNCSDELYLTLYDILKAGEPYSNETTKKYKELNR
jgi:hypothetical protein